MTPVVYADAETFSRCNLKTQGGRKYAAHWSTGILCWCAVIDWGERLTVVGWGPQVHPGKVNGWAVSPEQLKPLGFDPSDLEYEEWSEGLALPAAVLEAMAHGATFVAHNAAQFDRHIWEEVCDYPPVPWRDSMELARRVSLPSGLEHVGSTLFGVGKDDKGNRLVKRLCKPKPAKKNQDPKDTEFMIPDAPQMRTVVRYCVLDCLLMAAACNEEGLLEPHMDDPVLAAHRAIDDRGFAVDVPLARALRAYEAHYADWWVEKSARIVGDDADATRTLIRSNTALPRWLKSRGVNVLDTKRETIEAALAECKVPALRTVLETRLAISTVTSGKVNALLGITETDDRCRGSTAYCAAHTWRWGGRKFQPQNLPRPPKGFTLDHVQRILACIDCVPEIAKELGTEVQNVLSACLRALVKAPKGKVLAQVDMDQIEGRVVLWLCNDEEGLAVYANSDKGGPDPYVVQASAMGDGVSRQIGKVAKLALGYGGSVGAFVQMAGNYGLDTSDMDVEAVVEAYRDANPLLAGKRTGGKKVKELEDGELRTFVFRRGGFWKDCGKAAEFVVRSIGGPKPVTSDNPVWVNRVAFFSSGPDLHMWLPSGRSMRYRNAAIETVPDKWGPGQPGDEIRFDFVKKGSVIRGGTYSGRLVENCWAAETPVLTPEGWRPIACIRPGDKVWDGIEWVETNGALRRGKKEVGTWLGTQVTADHKILDGATWKRVTDLGVSASLGALSLGHALAPSWSLIRNPGLQGEPSVSALVGGQKKSPLASCIGGRDSVAGSVCGSKWVCLARETLTLCPTQRCGPYGSTGEPELSLVATHPATKPSTTTGHVGSISTLHGCYQCEPGWSTLSRCHYGIPKGSTWTESTTKVPTCQETSGLSAERPTRATDERPFGSNTTGNKCLIPSSGKPTHPTGPTGLEGGTSPTEKTRRGLWSATGQREEVFDLLNCGPRSRYMVLTSQGPVIAHNCTQAVARDALGLALVELERRGFKTVLTVHDEVLVELDDDETAEAKLAEVQAVLSARPPWADGLPLGAKGALTPCYSK